MKYKLLKDTPTDKAGTIKDIRNWMYIFNMKGNEIMDSEWFEPVEEFKKEIDMQNWKVEDGDDYNRVSLTETFATEEQAKAKKELMEHIVKFEEPKEGVYYTYFDVNLKTSFVSNYEYKSKRDKIDFHSGVVMNYSVSEEDQEERIRLLNNYINSLKS